MLTLSRRALIGAASALALFAGVSAASAADAKLKIGFVGVTSGPAAAWGTSNVRSMQTLAEFSPMAWGLQGFHTIMLRHGGFADILQPVVQLLAFAAAALAAAVWLNHRQSA